jgi:hypothetical protein
MIGQFQKFPDMASPLAQEMQMHLNAKNPERIPDAVISDTELELLKTDPVFLQLFIANPDKIQSYKVA